MGLVRRARRQRGRWAVRVATLTVGYPVRRTVMAVVVALAGTPPSTGVMLSMVAVAVLAAPVVRGLPAAAHSMAAAVVAAGPSSVPATLR